MAFFVLFVSFAVKARWPPPVMRGKGFTTKSTKEHEEECARLSDVALGQPSVIGPSLPLFVLFVVKELLGHRL